MIMFEGLGLGLSLATSGFVAFGEAERKLLEMVRRGWSAEAFREEQSTQKAGRQNTCGRSTQYDV